MLTFRSGAAGYYDLLNDGGTGNFGGFKSGCTSNLVVANGVLNARITLGLVVALIRIKLHLHLCTCLRLIFGVSMILPPIIN